MPRSDCVFCESSNTRGKLLKCLHSICVECLEKHTNDNSSVGCPGCGAITPPPLAGVPLLQYLPDSDVLSGDAGEATAIMQNKLCDECAEDTVAVAICMDCGDHFCTDHAKGHPKSRKSYRHKVVPLSEADSSSPSARRPTPGSKCALHPSSEQSHFCMVCRKILCDKCLEASNRHDQHRQDLLPIEQAVSTIRDSLIAKMTASFSGEGSELESALATTDKALSQLHDQTETVSSEINDFFTQLKTVIDKR
ncbi:E3 ubiquitin-protein ligase TRIM56-like [Sycon ciliatum]|uniref:E3 ubiquitin-protein ligase TRIM56-like n=1 Tax=Sycon ciliatum TaxID=27933 RepID=UPI0031F69C22